MPMTSCATVSIEPLVKPLPERMARIPSYVQICTGFPASVHEIAAFQTDHDFIP